MMRRVLVLTFLLSSATSAIAQAVSAGPTGIEVGPQHHVSADLPNLPHVEPIIVVNPHDPRHLVAAAIVIRDARSERLPDTWTVEVLVSVDGGVSWGRRQLPRLNGTFSGDPWLAWGDDGTLYLSCLANLADATGRPSTRAWLFRSQDGGRTWSDPEQVPFGEINSFDHPIVRAVPGGGLHFFATGDTPDVAVAPGRMVPSPRRLASARMLSDGALEAVTGYRPRGNSHMGSGVVFGAGRFLLNYYNLSSDQPSVLWAVRSADGGQSYERTAITSEHVPLLFTMMAAGRSPDASSDRVYAVWTRSLQRPHVMVGYSDDHGATWSVPHRVHADSSSALRIAPTVAVSRTGDVAVAWIESRSHEHLGADSLGALLRREGSMDCWDVYAAISRDGAATFSSPIRLTPQTSCSNAEGNGSAGRRFRHGGDYLGLAWDSDGALNPLWADSRTGTYQLWTARITVK
jgi:hypothetical protein